jgi:glycosyltransferase involved in cell wall biosynthesis
MRVLLVSPFGLRDKGGMGRLLVYLTDYWNSRCGAPVCRVVDSRGVGRKIWWPLYYAKACAGVLAELLRGRVDVAHLHMASHGSTIRKMGLVWLIAQFHVPIVLHLHGGNFDQFWRALPGFLQRRVRRMFDRVSQVIVLGEMWRDFLCRDIGLPAHRVHILMNAVPGPDRAPTIRQSTPCRILFLGRLEPTKGVAELIEALASADMQALAWDAVLAGSGDINGYRAMVKAAGLEDRVSLPGWVTPDGVRDYLHDADILVLPSHFEGLSLAILEGMAYGLAVITTPVGSIPEAITHGESGLFVPVQDPAALAGALRLVLCDDQLRVRLAEGARRRYLEVFEIGQYAGKLEELYRQCQTGNPPTQAQHVARRATS